LEISNRLKRIITAIIGITVIILGLEYLPSISFNTFIDFSIHPLVLAALIIFFYEIFRQYLKNPNSRNSKYYIFCITYIIFFTHVVLIENIMDNWKIIFLFVLSQVFVIDSSGYFVGKLLGRSKIKFLSKISPNKTTEGYTGSIIIGFLYGFISLYIINNTYFDNLGIFTISLITIGIVFSSITGDLSVSKIKRILDIDDFSTLFYGHGGILDRLDSILPSFTLFFWIFFLT
tara:strand:+ start:19 stop:714 length:696 start_codon:yes stop_codon:yes gene_type:complete